MGKVLHRKLIRDNAPDNMRKAGVTFETRQLEEVEFKKELLKKVIEEAGELCSSEGNENMAGELADILDIIDEIKKTFDISEAGLTKARAINAKKKGGFEQRILLEGSNVEQKGS